ncbi:MAG: alpha/beta hydrolase [Chloroflexi bacterium]|nr:MAG: alpha/beta hydrolase [Chloroflexota bacterium]
MSATAMRADGSVRSEPADRPEQTRARYPDETGVIERDGVRVAWERYGDGSPTILLMPTWSIIHSRLWKQQIPDLARRHRVIAFDGRGNGRSARPPTAEAYAEAEFAADALAVMDATSTERAVVITLSMGAQRGLLLASDHADRVAGMVFIGPSLALQPRAPDREAVNEFLEPPVSDEGWAKYNAHSWRRDYRGFLEFFFSQCFSEAHSTKPIEDAVGWGLETDPETLILTELAPGIGDRDAILARCARVTCPVLVIHGGDDRITPHARGEALARATRGRLVTIEGGGHIPNARDPVKVNLAIRDFVGRLERLERLGRSS